MFEAKASWLALALILAAGPAIAGEWRCGATASFSDGSVGVYVYADDGGKLTMQDGVAVVEYTPGPPRNRLELTLIYAASLPANAMFPLDVKATVPVKRDAGGGQVVLTVGDAKATWPILPAFFANSSDFTMWIDLKPSKALSEALLADGKGRFSIIGKNGEVLDSQDLNILGAAQLLPMVAKAHPVAVGFAAAPRRSSYCEPNRPVPAKPR